MSSSILGFQEIDKAMLALVGGKGANLGELFKIEGIRVPDGICITTEVYKELIKGNGEFNSLLGELAILKVDNRKSINEISAKIRTLVERIAIPKDIANGIVDYLTKF